MLEILAAYRAYKENLLHIQMQFMTSWKNIRIVELNQNYLEKKKKN